MDISEVEYLVNCFKSFNLLVSTTPVDAISMLKFNTPLDSGKTTQQKWDGTIDAFSTMYKEELSREKQVSLLNKFKLLLQKKLGAGIKQISITSSSTNIILKETSD